MKGRESGVLEHPSGLKIYNFSCFDICYSPDFLVSRMGSFVSQLATVARIWLVKVRLFSAVFAHLHRKIPKILTPIFRAIYFSEPLGHLFGLKIGMGDHLYRKNAIVTLIFDFSVVCFFQHFCPKFWAKSPKWPIFWTKMSKKTQKTEKLKIYATIASILCIEYV